MKNILICPIAAIRHEIEGSSAFFILCSGILYGKETGKNVISLPFHDTENASDPNAVQPCQAGAIVDYFRQIPDGADVFVCCDSGESRSPAVAAALMRSQGQSDLEIWDCPDYHPNVLVYKLVCEYAGIRLWSGELKSLRDRNEAALRRAIQNGG